MTEHEQAAMEAAFKDRRVTIEVEPGHMDVFRWGWEARAKYEPAAVCNAWFVETWQCTDVATHAGDHRCALSDGSYVYWPRK